MSILIEDLVREFNRPLRHPKPVYVYLFSRNGKLKIGISQDPERRALELERYPNRCEILADFECSARGFARIVERKAHEAFAKYRIESEWFEDVPEIRAAFGCP